MTEQTVNFQEIVKQNKRRIHYYIHRLQIRDPHHDFYQEGLIALWDAYKTYKPDKGPMGTYFNYVIRNRLIDQIRKSERIRTHDEQFISHTEIQLSDGNHKTQISTSSPLPKMERLPLPNDEIWHSIRSQLTDKQWAWVYYFIIEKWSQKEIANHFDTTVAAVNSWARSVRKKLKNETFKEQLYKHISS